MTPVFRVREQAFLPGDRNQWQAKIHIPLSILASRIIDKHWQAKFHITLSILDLRFIDKHWEQKIPISLAFWSQESLTTIEKHSFTLL